MESLQNTNYHCTYREFGLLGLITSSSRSLEFRLGWGALLELRKLFTFEEMTDSRLELMMLFLFSSRKHQNPRIISGHCKQSEEQMAVKASSVPRKPCPSANGDISPELS